MIRTRLIAATGLLLVLGACSRKPGPVPGEEQLSFAVPAAWTEPARPG